MAFCDCRQDKQFTGFWCFGLLLASGGLFLGKQAVKQGIKQKRRKLAICGGDGEILQYFLIDFVNKICLLIGCESL